MTTRQSKHAALMRRRAEQAAAIEAQAVATLRTEHEAVRAAKRRAYSAEYDLLRKLSPFERLWLDARRRPFDFPPHPIPRSTLCDILFLHCR